MKNKLWRLIEYYLDKKIDEVVFCSDFFLLYVHEIDYNDFDDQIVEIRNLVFV